MKTFIIYHQGLQQEYMSIINANSIKECNIIAESIEDIPFRIEELDTITPGLVWEE